MSNMLWTLFPCERFLVSFCGIIFSIPVPLIMLLSFDSLWFAVKAIIQNEHTFRTFTLSSFAKRFSNRNEMLPLQTVKPALMAIFINGHMPNVTTLLLSLYPYLSFILNKYVFITVDRNGNLLKYLRAKWACRSKILGIHIENNELT